MNDSKNRRSFLKRLGFGFAFIPFSISGISSLFSFRTNPSSSGISVKREGGSFIDNFLGLNERIWIGPDYWAIPMEDWKVKDGRLEFKGKEKNSRVNILTTCIIAGPGELVLRSRMGLMDTGQLQDGKVGYTVGIKDNIDPDVRAACYYGEGIKMGLSSQGKLFIEDREVNLPPVFSYSTFILELKAKTASDGTQLLLTCIGDNGTRTELRFHTSRDIEGLVALENNFDVAEGAAFWFKEIYMSGTKFQKKPDNSFGPILWCMHTISKGILKISAQLPPISPKDNQNVELYFDHGKGWKLEAVREIDAKGLVASFTVDKWNPDRETPYQVVYVYQRERHTYSGIIRREPKDRALRFGSLTCQHSDAFPYSPLVQNLTKHDPDMLYFSGDQLYETNGNYPIKRSPEQEAILSYLGKWYMFGWAFGNVMRDRPTICTPDDHDVFHGNLWGEGGKPIGMDDWENRKKDAVGGYVQTAGMVNVVTLTQCGHLPDPFYPEPLKTGIKTWITNLVYGNVSFAIISDRMFKSGPDNLRKGDGRIDHIKEPLKKGELENPDLEFLGNLQMKFLESWTEDWGGASMKVLLSQTLFANLGTHHGAGKMFLYGDMDSGGWPKHQRDQAIRILRKSYGFHVNGDQHLPFLVQYSLDEKRDAPWTFSSPAISTGYPRWAEPDLVNSPYSDRPAHGMPNTGCYTDVFGNLNYVYAVGNPKDDYTNKNRYIQAQNKSSGFGLIIFDTQLRTIRMEAYRFLSDKDKQSIEDQFPGWPFTISQMENDGRQPNGFLPIFQVNKPHQLIKVYLEDDGQLINVLRINGTQFQPSVFQTGSYKVVIGEGKKTKVFNGILPATQKSAKTIKVNI